MAIHHKVVHHLPYRQQTRALPTADIRFSHRPTPLHVDLPKQEPFCTPHGKIVPVDDELFTQTLKFKLRVLAQELEALDKMERVCLTSTESATHKTDIDTRGWDIPGYACVSKKDDRHDHVPSI